MAKKNWIQNAIKNPGSFTATAKREGGIGKNGKIKQSFIEKEKHSSNPTTRRRANLADTLSKLARKK